MKRLVLVAVLLGLLQFAAYWLASSFAALDGRFPSPQPDTKLYCQAARRIVEGHPFSYSEGDAVSTGTTSVAYPFVLAVPYVCGATGNRLMVAGCFLNGFFYLVFLVGWAFVAARWLFGQKSRYVAIALLGLAAQPAICAFGQTDTGMWMAASAVLAAALSWRRMGWATVFLLLAPWVRPEGMIVVIALGLATAICSPRSRCRWGLFGLGLLSSLAVFAFNWYLTGRFQFDSVAHKGYFKTLPFLDAIGITLRDGMSILRTFFVGTTSDWPQSIYFIPVLGGLFMAAGIAAHRWHRERSFPAAVLVISTLGSLCMVASSGWQGSNCDRYLAWTMPVFLLFVAEGAVSLGGIPFLRRVRHLPISVCLAFYAVTAIAGVALLHAASKSNAQNDEFQRTCEQVLAEADRTSGRSVPVSVGGRSCTDAYEYSARRFVHLAGIYSPDFLDYYYFPWAIELLKRRPDLRFDYWSLAENEYLGEGEALDKAIGRQCVAGPHNRELREADWAAFDAGETRPTAPEGKRLVARLDLGYLPEEKQADYEVLDRWGREPEKAYFMAAPLGDRMTVDCTRSIQGGDMFSVPLVPGCDCIVSMRTLSRHGAVVLTTPVRMLLQVDGRDIGNVQYDLDVKTNAFQEVTFRIPGSAIVNSPCRIGLLGDHIASGYWFWQ